MYEVCVCVRGSLTLPTLSWPFCPSTCPPSPTLHQECPLPRSPIQPVGVGCEVCMWEGCEVCMWKVCVCRKCVSACGRYVRYACGGMCECMWEVCVCEHTWGSV